MKITPDQVLIGVMCILMAAFLLKIFVDWLFRDKKDTKQEAGLPVADETLFKMLGLSNGRYRNNTRPRDKKADKILDECTYWRGDPIQEAERWKILAEHAERLSTIQGIHQANEEESIETYEDKETGETFKLKRNQITGKLEPVEPNTTSEFSGSFEPSKISTVLHKDQNAKVGKAQPWKVLTQQAIDKANQDNPLPDGMVYVVKP